MKKNRKLTCGFYKIKIIKIKNGKAPQKTVLNQRKKFIESVSQIKNLYMFQRDNHNTHFLKNY